MNNVEGQLDESKLPISCWDIIAAHWSFLALCSSTILLSSSILAFVAEIESIIAIFLASLRVFTIKPWKKQ